MYTNSYWNILMHIGCSRTLSLSLTLYKMSYEPWPEQSSNMRKHAHTKTKETDRQTNQQINQTRDRQTVDIWRRLKNSLIASWSSPPEKAGCHHCYHEKATNNTSNSSYSSSTRNSWSDRFRSCKNFCKQNLFIYVYTRTQYVPIPRQVTLGTITTTMLKFMFWSSDNYLIT